MFNENNADRPIADDARQEDYPEQDGYEIGLDAGRVRQVILLGWVCDIIICIRKNIHDAVLHNFPEALTLTGDTISYPIMS